jgi:predicted tellurium resistance membrane protein TerC
MNLKRLTFKNVKEGLLNLTPEQQLKGKMIGLIGGIVGLILAMFTFIYTKRWGFTIFIFFLIWLQFIQFIGTRQQYIQTKEIFREINTQQQDIESPKMDNEIGNIK